MSGTSSIHATCDSKQVTFDLTKISVLYWRRALLLRYFLNLGSKTEFNVIWEDSDKKNNQIILKDEESSFEDKLPDTALFKTFIQVIHNDHKLITITLYYTTYRCLVQGVMCQKWINREFGKIKKTIEMCLRGGNPKGNIDSMTNKLNPPPNCLK